MNIHNHLPDHHPPQHDSRCCFASSDGRRCRMLRAPGHPALCFHHAREEQLFLDAPKASAKLASPTGEFHTAYELNASLSQLYKLVAANRIAPRTAATLAYIAQLIMQTLPRVQSEIHSSYGPKGWHNFLDDIFDVCNPEPASTTPAAAAVPAPERPPVQPAPPTANVNPAILAESAPFPNPTPIS